MAAEGFYLVQGDKTTCSGKITTGAEDHTLFDKPFAREQDSVTCGKHAGLFKIAGGIDKIPFMIGEWPEPSTATVHVPARRSLFHQ